MANGRRFNPDALTAASWDYPLGSKLRLVHGNKSVVVEVTDRGGARAVMQFGKVVDLSRAAFARLERPAVGSIRVKLQRGGTEEPSTPLYNDPQGQYNPAAWGRNY